MNGFGRPPLSLMEGYCNGTQETSLNPDAAPFVPSYRSVENRREFGGNSAANIRGKMRLNHNALSNIRRCFVVRAKKIEPREESLQNLRDRLIEQLENNSYECMICCQIVEANQWIWTCQKCFHMFHIRIRIMDNVRIMICEKIRIFSIPYETKLKTLRSWWYGK
ncbi:hypothetical protein AB6A40_006766 [Gnathostoma spinigerum]|uniref:Uncharacterized protein n=1 Tax=Gnathostoma spinigerum TaxID=75299 RepID=A0ABD6ETP3_9BILA